MMVTLGCLITVLLITGKVKSAFWSLGGRQVYDPDVKVYCPSICHEYDIIWNRCFARLSEDFRGPSILRSTWGLGLVKHISCKKIDKIRKFIPFSCKTLLTYSPTNLKKILILYDRILYLYGRSSVLSVSQQKVYACEDQIIIQKSTTVKPYVTEDVVSENFTLPGVIKITAPPTDPTGPSTNLSELDLERSTNVRILTNWSVKQSSSAKPNIMLQSHTEITLILALSCSVLSLIISVTLFALYAKNGVLSFISRRNRHRDNPQEYELSDVL